MAESRLGSQSDEILSDGSPTRNLYALSAESLTNNSTSSRQLTALSSESLTNASNGSPIRQLSGITVEVIAPARLGYIGWGTPIKSPTWN